MKNEAVIILAAGRGSRAGNLTDSCSKCSVDLGGTCSLLHTLLSFHQAGVHNAIVIVGYKSDNLIKTVSDGLSAYKINMNVQYIDNPDYDYHGCEYSLSCATKVNLSQYTGIYITEGDLVMHPAYIKTIISNSHANAALVRDPSKIIDTKSVVGITNRKDGKINQYIYDSDHKSVMSYLPEGYKVVGDSMQLWKISGKSLESFIRLIDVYRMKADMSKSIRGKPMTENGLFSINRLIRTRPFYLYPIMMEGSNWFNINTESDYEYAKSLPWLNRFT